MCMAVVNVWGKRFKLPQLTHESFLTIDPSRKIFFWYLPNWTSTDLWCVVLYVTYSSTHQRLVEVQFGRYQKNVLQEWSMVKKLSGVSCGTWVPSPYSQCRNMILFVCLTCFRFGSTTWKKTRMHHFWYFHLFSQKSFFNLQNVLLPHSQINE